MRNILQDEKTLKGMLEIPRLLCQRKVTATLIYCTVYNVHTVQLLYAENANKTNLHFHDLLCLLLIVVKWAERPETIF